MFKVTLPPRVTGVKSHLSTEGSHSVKRQNAGPFTTCQKRLAKATAMLSRVGSSLC